ncbi:MAG TPA: pyruvate:ferredoxin (flavodoxin) oxidoreductase [Kiritimatiellia bacterium]|jgi:pyruvate-ferredoxin/flavodoxin oxidoreductase|nr:pyruvate:ferredoxin (flavodoxin) oxidoreductase [Kiritimatiellia bacterium]HPV45986.1 pyruvate:ferredoxin (flavodoxin) oxidoreductase [Kiritimatiellia bacterium]HQK43678.1 pyruvate:ferredoxin (flavodoxin) oxidoreductase [Kiritimatiellia bacterium]HQM22967.1 pyruvate:ferredoxin (flavodoxin) oxidoreductase [Kiritimatiellia bacterium]
MSKKKQIAIIDGNEAAAHIAYKTTEIAAIYPITPSSNMGEWADEWMSEGKTNIWGAVPTVVEMQSEGGAAGAVHGALQTGALTTTFTASQGLLLMIPNMYKIAGELTSTVFHVSARSLAASALSIFGDHQDVMACRQIGWAMLASNSVQEVLDTALIAQAATLKARVPFLHFFDGFRTSHEISKIEMISDDVIRAMVSDQLVADHRARALNPEKPFIRGTAQNPDVYFQGREAANKFYEACPDIVAATMDEFAKLTGRQYRPFDYIGAPDAERVIVLMGSGAETALETIEVLQKQGEKVGAIVVRLYRPFAAKYFFAALPKSVKAIGVLDRTKEPGSDGEPLYKDVLSALAQGVANGSFPTMPKVIGGRYGLSSKEFTPAMVKAVFDELKKDAPKNGFTVGIVDDVTHTHLDIDTTFFIRHPEVTNAMFFGLGADGTVGANKNSIKIIGEETDFYAQGYFVYDSKKSGSRTISHLRFGPNPIHSPYLIQKASFVACHQYEFLLQTDILRYASTGSTFLLNSPFSKEEVWDKLPKKVQARIIEKKIKFYNIDAYTVAERTGMGTRVNTIMQTCFFAISGVLPKDEAIAKIKDSIQKTYGRKGDDIVQQNFKAVDETLANLYEIPYSAVTSTIEIPPTVSPQAPEFVKEVIATIMVGDGDSLPVSKMPIDGTFPSATTRWEKRNVSLSVPIWDENECIQCGTCSFVCPHACIRANEYDKSLLDKAPAGFKHAPVRNKPDKAYTLQIYVEDCTGCGVCVASCPKKNKNDPTRKSINLGPKLPIVAQERENIKFFETLPLIDRAKLNLNMVKDAQYTLPLFEFSGACAGCGETPYLSLLSKLFGDRAVVANATGCSSIYGGNLPTTPWAQNRDGRGPVWSNSLFEDNAEFGLGFRLTSDQQKLYAEQLVATLKDDLGAELADGILQADQKDEAGIAAQRARVAELKKKLAGNTKPEAFNLLAVADFLIQRSVWIVGGDGWAYDIGYGGLDHVLASGANVNILVLDTEVYSNTGGQASKSTPRGAVAKFAAGGKPVAKKDLAMIAMSYENVYVARVAFGANPPQAIKAFKEAEAHDGPSIIIAYSHCIAHGMREMRDGLEQQKLAVNSGHWILCRRNPALAAAGKNPLQLDSKAPSVPLKDYIYNETRYKMLLKSNPEAAAQLLEKAQADVHKNWAKYAKMADVAPAAPAPANA